MAEITVEDLNLTGSELLLDEESFLNNLSEEKLEQTYGGATPVAYTVYVVIAVGAGAFGYNVGRNDR